MCDLQWTSVVEQQSLCLLPPTLHAVTADAARSLRGVAEILVCRPEICQGFYPALHKIVDYQAVFRLDCELDPACATPHTALDIRTVCGFKTL